MVSRGAMDQSKKTMRHFYCRDVLWETFEQMANDFDCSIDYLINEAMRFYARSKNYQAGQSSQSIPTTAPPAPQPPSAGNGGAVPAPPVRPRATVPPPPPVPSVSNATPSFGAPALGGEPRRATVPPPPP